MRWSQKVEFYPLKLPASIDTVSEGGVKLHCTISREEQELNFAFEISGREKAELPEHIEWYYEDHVVFFFDFSHNHMTEHIIAVRRNGETVSKSRNVLPGEEVNERITQEIESSSNPEFSASVFDRNDVWGGALKVDTRTIESPVIGFSVKGVSGRNPVSSAEFPECSEEWLRNTPLGYADLYLNECSITVDCIDFGEPEWKKNKGLITARSKDKAAYILQNQFIYPGDSEVSRTELNPPRSEFFYTCDFKAKWTNGIDRTAGLYISIENDSNAIWTGTFPAGFDSGIIIRDRTGGGMVKKPSADSPEYSREMREYLLSKLPDFSRVTTKDGAPSDFCLKSEELDVTINLLDDDIYGTIADIIALRFPEWEHGFAAGAVFLGSAAGIRHSSQNAALANSLHPEGILQLGAGFCGQQSICFDLLAERLSERYNKNIRVYSIGLRGHIAAAVRFDDSGDYIIFDPMLGLFYYSEDNSRFATLDEMKQNKDIAYRMDAYCSAHGHEFYYGIEHHVISPVSYSGRRMA